MLFSEFGSLAISVVSIKAKKKKKKYGPYSNHRGGENVTKRFNGFNDCYNGSPRVINFCTFLSKTTAKTKHKNNSGPF